ncbi:alpha/beta fold hydrolase [Burkholderia plantarii]|uniref:alpha/beta fold hydrolase n=1 Tax=Burkholderia plantarii TaxID=41899 RepID=UPI0009F67321|nr:alpha/beta hydrolase [Burkholderia plantarii]WLE61775.1 alpha/beta hydrolase [Burkholderia plantarii]
MTSTPSTRAAVVPAPASVAPAIAACYLGGADPLVPERFLRALSSRPVPVMAAGELAMQTQAGANPLLDVLAACARRLRDEAPETTGATPPLLIAHGLGAMLAAELACLDGLDSAPRAPLVLISPLGLWLDAHPLANLLALGPDAATGLLWHDPAHPDARRMQAHWPARGMNALSRIAWPFAEHGLRHRLPHLRRRVLVIAGAQDRFTPPAYARAFVERLPAGQASLAIMPDCGHLPMHERPDATAAAIHAFIAGLTPTNRSTE